MPTQPEKPQVLITCLSGYGHVEKLRAIAAGLVSRAYPVTFTTASVYRKGIEATGATFIPLRGAGDIDMDRLDESHPEFWKMPQGKERHEYAFNTFVTGPIPDSHDTVQAILADLKQRGVGVVVILQDTGFLGNNPILLGAPGIRVPVIGIGTARLAMKSIDTAPFNSGLPPDSSEEGRRRNIALQEEVEKSLASAQSVYEECLRSVGATRKAPFYMDSMVVLPDRFLQMSVAALEYPRSDMPKTIRFVGAVAETGAGKNLSSLGTVTETDKNALPPWWDMILKHERPLVVVSQGSKSTDPEQLILPTMRALQDKDVTVVATLVTVKNLDGFSVPANARIAKFIPFHEIFKYTDILVTNGGYGAVQQALYCAVPMILGGEGKDHTATNARVSYTGAAINLATSYADPDKVLSAAESILPQDSSYRARALELSKEYASHNDPIGAVAANIDKLGKAGVAHQTEQTGIPRSRGLIKTG